MAEGRLADLAKKMAPDAARIVPSSCSRAAGIFLDILQGKGSGTGWDLAGECSADATAVRGVERPLIIDGGANFGQWAQEIAGHLGNPNAQFVLFEPQDACQEALAALAIGNVRVVQAALGDHAGHATLSGAAPGFGAASLYERHDTYFDDMGAFQQSVALVTLDSCLSELSIDRVDLLKLDVEGAELSVLRGGIQSLRDGVIRAVSFEFGSANIYSRTFFRDFWELLAPLGFRFSRITPGGRLLSIPDYSEEHEHFRGVSNYLVRR